MTRKNYGWRPDIKDARDFNVHDYLKLDRATLAPECDLRPLLMTPYNQGRVGSCTGNSCAAALELDEILQTSGALKVTPSRLFLYYNARALEGSTHQDAGAMIRDVVGGVAKWGYCHESYWPYNEDAVTTAPASFAYGAAYAHRIGNRLYARVPQSINSLKQVIASQRGVIFGFTVYSSFEAIGSDGVMPMPNFNSEQVLGGHAVLMVGYSDARQAFIVRNSWGSDWGDGGYFYMPYQYALSHLASDFWVITQVPKAA